MSTTGLKIIILTIIFYLFTGCYQPPMYQPQPITYDNMNNPYNYNSVTVVQNPYIQHNIEKNNFNKDTLNKININSKIKSQDIIISATHYQTQIKGISSYEQCGITPVLVKITNRSDREFQIHLEQFSATGQNGEFAPYPPLDTFTIMVNSEGFRQVVNGAISGATTGAIGGALLGGLVSKALGGSFSDGARWGAVGGAVGGASGGAQAYKTQLVESLKSEIISRQLSSKIIYPNTTIVGVLYFPAGVKKLNIHFPDRTIHIQIF